MSNVRLLLVDDDRVILATLAKGLRGAGYETEVADCGEAALELAGTGRFDLAMLDIRMPRLSGIELARRLDAECTIPTLFLSAYCDGELVRGAVNAGCLGYVVKPVDALQLVPQIEAALARGRDYLASQRTISQLEQVLAVHRRTNVAIGILMERQQLSEAAAFEALRSAARARRRKLEDEAGDLVTGHERALRN